MRYLTIVFISLIFLAAASGNGFADAGKNKDAGSDIGSAIRILLQDQKEPLKGKKVSFSATLGSRDTVDTYKISPTISKNRYISLLVFAGQPVTLRVMDRKTDEVVSVTAGITGKKTIEFMTKGTIYLQVETAAGQPDFQYFMAIWLAPKPEKRKSGKEISVGKNINEPPPDFTVFKKPE
jgi:hypothetical protein